jgi:hypothetical protein
MSTPSGPYADLAHQVRQKREVSQLAAELYQVGADLRQKAAQLYPKLAKKRLWGLLCDAAEEADLQAKELGR